MVINFLEGSNCILKSDSSGLNIYLVCYLLLFLSYSVSLLLSSTLCTRPKKKQTKKPPNFLVEMLKYSVQYCV